MNVEPIERTAPDSDIHKGTPSVNSNVTQNTQAVSPREKLLRLLHLPKRKTCLAYRMGRKTIEGVESENRHPKIGIKMSGNDFDYVERNMKVRQEKPCQKNK